MMMIVITMMIMMMHDDGGDLSPLVLINPYFALNLSVLGQFML